MQVKVCKDARMEGSLPVVLIGELVAVFALSALSNSQLDVTRSLLFSGVCLESFWGKVGKIPD